MNSPEQTSEQEKKRTFRVVRLQYKNPEDEDGEPELVDKKIMGQSENMELDEFKSEMQESVDQLQLREELQGPGVYSYEYFIEELQDNGEWEPVHLY
jgi:hypothetical protein